MSLSDAALVMISLMASGSAVAETHPNFELHRQWGSRERVMTQAVKRRTNLNAFGGLGILGSAWAGQRALGQTRSTADPGAD